MSRIPRPGELGRLSRAEWALSLDAALLLPMAAVALTVGGVQPTCAVVDRWPMFSARWRRALTPHRVGTVVAAVASLYGARCLASAIVVHGVLRRLGVACELVIGVTGFGAQFRSHAWVERDGIVAPGQSAEGYRAIHRFTGPGPRAD